MTHEQIIDNMKTLAARLSATISFNYVTIEWNQVTECPVAKLWYNKPSYEHGWDDYDYEWEGWQPDESEETFITMINTEYLVGTSLGALPKDTDWSRLVIRSKR